MTSIAYQKLGNAAFSLLIAQSVLELSHCENGYDNGDDDTHPGWIIVRDGNYSVADKKTTWKMTFNGVACMEVT